MNELPLSLQQDEIGRNGSSHMASKPSDVAKCSEVNVWCLYIENNKLYLTNGSSAAKQVPGISVVEVRGDEESIEVLHYETQASVVSTSICSIII